MKYHNFVSRFSIGCILLAAGSAALHAEGFDPALHLKVDEIKPGMQGFGRSVFRGTEIATFSAEVVSVIKNFDPQLDVVLVRCSGQNLEHSGIIGGMSGSPVYIKVNEDEPAKLIGAVAYGWTFNKDPVCGVQPIEHMLEVGSGKASRAASGASEASRALAKQSSVFSDSRFTAAGVLDDLEAKWPQVWSQHDGLVPLSTPIMVSGMSSTAMALLKRELEPFQLVPMSAGQASGKENMTGVELEPGSALCVPLMTGDIGMAAFGTCTEVIGDRVYGFGHPFTRRGKVDMPMATGHVHTVISSVMRSFKLGDPIDIKGALTADGTAAIAGRLGVKSRMIPFIVNVDDRGTQRTYHYEAANDEFFTPMLAGSVMVSSASALSELPDEHTVRFKIEADFGEHGVFANSNIRSQSGMFWAMGELAGPLMGLMQNQYGRFPVKALRAEFQIEEKASLALLEQAVLLDDVVKPGSTLNIRVHWRKYRDKMQVAEYAFKLPEDITEGTHQLALTSATGHLRGLNQEKKFLFKSDNQAELMETFNLVSSFQEDLLYARLSTGRGGVAVDRNELPDLPDYLKNVYTSAEQRRIEVYLESLVQTFPLPFVFQGEARLAFKVDRRADQ